jgi:hypothetical protein
LSLCYDFQKWTIISLASIAISLTIGLLMQFAHGQEDNNNQTSEPKGVFESKDFSVTNLRTGEDNNRIVIAGTIKNISDKPISGISFAATNFQCYQWAHWNNGYEGTKIAIRAPTGILV